MFTKYVADDDSGAGCNARTVTYLGRRRRATLPGKSQRRQDFDPYPSRQGRSKMQLDFVRSPPEKEILDLFTPYLLRISVFPARGLDEKGKEKELR